VLVVVAMAVSEMMKDGALRETQCEHVPLRALLSEAVSRPCRQGPPSTRQPRASHARSPLSTPQHSLPRQRTPEHSTRCGDPQEAEEAGEAVLVMSGEGGGDSWFVDCSEMDLGNVYVQEVEKRVMAVPAAGGQGCCKGLVSITNPSSVDLDFQVCTLRCSGGSASDEASKSPTFVVGPAGQEAKAASLLMLTVPARHSRQLQIFLDTSTYDLSGRKECNGELRISKLSPPPPHRADACSGHTRAVSAYNSTSIPLSCVAGFCRLQIPGSVDQLHMACVRGERTKQSISLRNGGCLPATVRLSVEDEEDGLGRPLSLMRGILDDSLAGAGASAAGALRDEHGVFRVKQRELLLAPGQVTKVSVVFSPKTSSGLEDTPRDSEKLLSNVQITSAILHKSRLVLRVVEDGGVHYSVPLRGQASALMCAHLPLAAARTSPPSLPLTSACRPRNDAKRPAAPTDDKMQLEKVGAPPPGAAAAPMHSPPQLNGALWTGVREKEGALERVHGNLGATTSALQTSLAEVSTKPPHKLKRSATNAPQGRAERRRAHDDALVCNKEPEVRDAYVRTWADRACGSRESQNCQAPGAEALLAEEGTQTSFYGDPASADLREARNLRTPSALPLASERGNEQGGRQAMQGPRRATKDGCETGPLPCSGARTGGICHYTDKGCWEDMRAVDEPLHLGLPLCSLSLPLALSLPLDRAFALSDYLSIFFSHMHIASRSLARGRALPLALALSPVTLFLSYAHTHTCHLFSPCAQRVASEVCMYVRTCVAI
jgi:hypothetical protein